MAARELLPAPCAPASCAELLADIRRHNAAFPTGETITFTGAEGLDVYNIAAPFVTDGVEVIAGRVEPREDQLASEVRFFRRGAHAWTWMEQVRPLPLQDPFHAFIGGEHVIGGVFVFRNANGDLDGWETRFYKGRDLSDLEFFASGPRNMKDIRLIELPDARVGVYTRPHGMPDARAKIGYTEIESPNGLTPAVIAEAPLFERMFLPEEWGGANEVHRLEDGWHGILGHISCREGDDILHYYAMAFRHHPATGRWTQPKMIATREFFPPGPAKEPRLADVIFSGGLLRQNDGTAKLYAGLSDAQAGMVVIPDPFV